MDLFVEEVGVQKHLPSFLCW